LTTTITCSQLSPALGDLEHNLTMTVAAIKDAVEHGSQVVVLPELVTSGYSFATAAEARAAGMTRNDSIFDDWIAAAAGAAVVIGGFAEVDEAGTMFNSAVLLDPAGGRTFYRKTHLWDREKSVFAPGNELPPVVPTQFGAIGLLICYDMEFPELTRHLALAGADLLAVPANWPLLEIPPIGEHPAEVVIAMSTARVNHVAVACCDRSGEERGQRWTQASTIVAADGWIASQSNGQTLISAELDLEASQTKSISQRNDLFADRRTDLYRLEDAAEHD